MRKVLISVIMATMVLTTTLATAITASGATSQRKNRPLAPKLSYNPASLSYGIVPPGYSGTKRFEVWNSGYAELT